jgi:hypothetical protein
LLEQLSSKTPTTTNAGKDVGKMNPHTLMVGMQASKTTLKTIWRLLKKLNIDLPCDPAIPLAGIYPKECNAGNSKVTFTPMFVFIFSFTQIAKW